MGIKLFSRNFFFFGGGGGGEGKEFVEWGRGFISRETSKRKKIFEY